MPTFGNGHGNVSEMKDLLCPNFLISFNGKKMFFQKISKRLPIEIRIFSEKGLKKVKTSKLETGKNIL
jgi:hypothetical protein